MTMATELLFRDEAFDNVIKTLRRIDPWPARST